MSFFFVGCPYKSVVPVGDGDSNLSKEFCGIWTTASTLGYEEPNKVIIKLNKNNKKVDIIKIDNEYSLDTTEYIGLFTKVKENVFLSIINSKELDDNSPLDEINYYIYRIRKSRNCYLLEELNENIKESFTNSKEFQNYISENLDNELFYNNLSLTNISSRDVYLRLKN